MTKVVAAIPVRAGSVRIPNKNLQKVGRFSLVERKVRQLREARLVNEIVVATNCPEAAQIGKAAGATVVTRDERACDESRSSSNDMILDVVQRLSGDIVVWAHCTNPFIYGRHYDEAIKKFFESELRGRDSLVSVYRVQNHMWNQYGFPANYNPYAERHTLAKDLTPVFFQDGSIFIQRRQEMLRNSYFFGDKPVLMEIDFPYSHDINVPSDLEVAKLLVGRLDVVERFQLES